MWTEKDLAAIDEAIASGAQSVAYESKSITYRSLDEMRLIRDAIRKSLGVAGGPSNTLLAGHDRGFR
jgi:hypothetical protein